MMLSETVSQVLSTLPPTIAAVLEQCSEGPLHSSEELEAELARFP